MKKLFILIAFFVACKVGYGQGYPVTQNLGSTSTLVDVKGGQRIGGAFVLGHFTDTSAANAVPYVKNYANGLITVDTNLIFIRTYDAKRWLQVYAANTTPTGDTLVWSMSGNLVGSRRAEPVLGTLDPYPINFITNGLQRLIIPTGGITRYSSSSTKCLTYDTLTHQMYYYDCSGSGSGVNTLAAIGIVPNANGATISGTTLNLQPASSSFGGVVTTSAQSFAGVKTFTNNIVVQGTSDNVVAAQPTSIGSFTRYFINNTGSTNGSAAGFLATNNLNYVGFIRMQGSGNAAFPNQWYLESQQSGVRYSALGTTTGDSSHIFYVGVNRTRALTIDNSGLNSPLVTSGAGNKALRYNTATGAFTYADTTVSGGGGGSGLNIYNSDSTLKDNRTVTGSGRTLTFDGLGGMIVNSGTNDSLPSRLNYSWATNPISALWIKTGSTTTITTGSSRTDFAGGSSWGDYISGNPYYLSSQNWVQSGTVVPQTKSSTSYGFAVGMLGSPGSIFANFNLSDTAGYITLHNAASSTTIASGRGTETFIWAALDTLDYSAVMYNNNFTATLTNRANGQQLGLSYDYKLSYPTSVVMPNGALPSIFFFGGTWRFVGNYNFQARENKYPDILFAGNSITDGLNAANESVIWPNVATAGLTGNISIHGQPGQNIAGALLNVDEFTKYFKPRYAFLNYIVNDVNGGTAGATFSTNTQTLITALKDSSIIPVLINSTPQATSAVPLNDTLRALATRNSIGYIDIYTPLKNPSGVNMNPLYTDDNIHPNTLGHQIIGEVVRKYILDNNLTLTPPPFKVYPLPLQPNVQYLTGIDSNNNLVKVPRAENLATANLVQTSDIRNYTYTDKALNFLSGNSFVIKSTSSVAMTDPGAGSVFLFYPKQSATRAGYVTGTQNQPDSLGQYSFGGGYNTSAPGTYGMTYGLNLSNRAAAATAFGNGNTITSAANYAITAGFNNFLVGQSAAVFGSNNKADAYSLVAGNTNEGLNGYCFVAGHDNKANGNTSATIGANLTVVGNGSQAYGQYYNDNGGFVSTFIGDATNDPFTADAHKRLFARFLNGYKFMLSTSVTAMNISSTGALQLPVYGSGTFTGTATKNLSVDASGNVIETAISSGGSTYQQILATKFY